MLETAQYFNAPTDDDGYEWVAQWDEESPSAIHWALTILWMAFLLLRPIRVFPNGYPQPGDFLLLALFLLTLIFVQVQIDKAAMQLMTVFALLVSITICVNMIWMFLDGQLSRLVYGIFFGYNFLAFAEVLILCGKMRQKFIYATSLALIISLLVQATVIAVPLGVANARSVGLFENPNQLGYYALLAGCIVYVCSKQQNIGWLTTLMPFCLLLVFFEVCVSLSRGAIIGAFFLIGGWFVTTRQNLGVILILAIVVSLGGLLVTYGGVLTSVENRFRDNRLTSTEKQIGVRGYDRIFNNPELMLFGAGEGGKANQFDASHHGEMHSSLGTMLFSYGILGFLVFLLLIGVAAKENWSVSVAALVPVAAYSLTHNGLRQAEFWILIALLGVQASQKGWHGLEPVQLHDVTNRLEGDPSSFPESSWA